MSAVEVRRLARSDLVQAPALLGPEGWNFELAELERLHRLGGASGAFDVSGRLVAYLSFVDLAPVRWIGNVVTDSSLRGQGVGARVVQDALTDAPRAGLFAVEKAVTLYQRLGFASAGGDAWAHRAESAKPVRPSVTHAMTREDLLDVTRLDRHQSGMDRGFLFRELLRAYPDAARIVRSGNHVIGFGFAKTSPGLTELGPIVATTARAGEDILDALVSSTPGPHEATALAANPRALDALRARGFAQTFRTITMFKGAPLPWRPESLVAVAGLEKG